MSRPVHALTVGAFQHVLELLVCQLDHVKVDAGLVENFRDRDLALAMLNHGLINFCRAAPHKVQVFLERLFEGERAVTVGAFEFPARPVTMAGPQVDEVLVGARQVWVGSCDETHLFSLGGPKAQQIWQLLHSV